jgi:hypothetical protein
MAFHFLPMEYRDSLLGIQHFGQLDKRESARRPGIQVTNHLYGLDFETALFNPDLKFRFAGQMRQVSDIKP